MGHRNSLTPIVTNVWDRANHCDASSVEERHNAKSRRTFIILEMAGRSFIIVDYSSDSDDSP
jgi:hypothetical protein